MRWWTLGVVLIVSLPMFAFGQDPRDYGVYCIHGKLAVVQKPIEEVKCSLGGEVCRLEQDLTDAGARDKATRLGGIGAQCTCD